MLSDASEHPGTDLFGVMKGEDIIRPANALQCSMRAGLALNLHISHTSLILARGHELVFDSGSLRSAA